MQKLLFSIRLLLCQYGVNPLFLIKIDNGAVTKICGQVKPSFLADCLEIANRNEIHQAFVFASMGAFNKPVVKASANIPKDVLQQLRNAYGF
jgi:hypothetical protein